MTDGGFRTGAPRDVPPPRPVPAPGGYQLTMVSGADRGCFLVTFTK